MATASPKCCFWCEKRHVCQLPRRIYNAIEKQWGYWFTDTMGFSEEIHKTIAHRCKFYKKDKSYKEGNDIPSCYTS